MIMTGVVRREQEGKDEPKAIIELETGSDALIRCLNIKGIRGTTNMVDKEENDFNCLQMFIPSYKVAPLLLLIIASLISELVSHLYIKVQNSAGTKLRNPRKQKPIDIASLAPFLQAPQTCCALVSLSS